MRLLKYIEVPFYIILCFLFGGATEEIITDDRVEVISPNHHHHIKEVIIEKPTSIHKHPEIVIEEKPAVVIVNKYAHNHKLEVVDIPEHRFMVQNVLVVQNHKEDPEHRLHDHFVVIDPHKRRHHHEDIRTVVVP